MAEARFEVTRAGNAVQRIEARLPGGDRLVADRFDRSAAAINEERQRFALPGVCERFPTTAACHRSCAWASFARPFRRLSRFDSDGRLRWRWTPPEQALSFEPGDPLGGTTGSPPPNTGCVAPNGRFLTVRIYAPGNPFALGYGMIRLAPRPGFVDATGERTGETFSLPRYTAPIGWRAPATFVFQVENQADGGAAVREEVPLR